jgi:signal peptidase II
MVDQASKIFVKTNFILEKKLKFSDGLNSFFIENEEWLGRTGGTYGKLFLTVLDWLQLVEWILVMGFCERHSSNYLIVAIALILEAFGNT